VKTATARATEAIEAAQMMFADEMGATLDLSPAARVALIETIAAAIRTAIAEEQQNLEPTDDEVLASSTCLNHAIAGSRLPPSPRIRTLPAIAADRRRRIRLSRAVACMLRCIGSYRRSGCSPVRGPWQAVLYKNSAIS
jgi:hypothetical protein